LPEKILCNPDGLRRKRILHKRQREALMDRYELRRLEASAKYIAEIVAVRETR
jgi:hypothetical protein